MMVPTSSSAPRLGPLWLVPEMIITGPGASMGTLSSHRTGTDEGSYPQPVFTVNDGVGARGVLLINPTAMGTRTV